MRREGLAFSFRLAVQWKMDRGSDWASEKYLRLFFTLAHTFALLKRLIHWRSFVSLLPTFLGLTPRTDFSHPILLRFPFPTLQQRNRKNFLDKRFFKLGALAVTRLRQAATQQRSFRQLLSLRGAPPDWGCQTGRLFEAGGGASSAESDAEKFATRCLHGLDYSLEKSFEIQAGAYVRCLSRSQPPLVP